MKIMSSRYERRREREPEADERTQRAISPGPPRKRSRTDTELSGSRSVYQRPKSPSSNPHTSIPRGPDATTHYKPPEAPTPSVRPQQDDRSKPSPRLHKTPQNPFPAQTSASPPIDHKDNHTPTPAAPSKISSALATLSSSTVLSSMLLRTDGAENPQRDTNTVSQSPAPTPVPASASGVSAAQFDLAKLHSLSQALQNRGPTSAAPTNDNGNGHPPKQAALTAEPRQTHMIPPERSSPPLVRYLALLVRSATDCPRRRRHLTLIGSMSVLCTMRENFANDVLQRALARVNVLSTLVDIGGRASDHILITPIMGTGRQCTFRGDALGLLC